MEASCGEASYLSIRVIIPFVWLMAVLQYVGHVNAGRALTWRWNLEWRSLVNRDHGGQEISLNLCEGAYLVYGFYHVSCFDWQSERSIKSFLHLCRLACAMVVGSSLRCCCIASLCLGVPSLTACLLSFLALIRSFLPVLQLGFAGLHLHLRLPARNQSSPPGGDRGSVREPALLLRRLRFRRGTAGGVHPRQGLKLPSIGQRRLRRGLGKEACD